MSNELSELQAVDFAVGDFIAKAFDGLSLTTGPKEWREFLGRATSAQVYRHDAASPGEFLKALQASRKTETGPANKRLNAPTLPAVYYFRKPGFTNVNDRSKQIRGRYAWSEDLARAYNIRLLQLDLDYTIVFVAWDKPTLDKMIMAWYAYIVVNDHATAKFQIGSDVMDVPVIIADHCNLTVSDSSEPAENGRLFAATAPYNMHTLILFGAEVALPPVNMRVRYGLGSTEIKLVVVGYGDGVATVFDWDFVVQAGKAATGIIGIELELSGVKIARWNGTRLVSIDGVHTVTGSVAIDLATTSIAIVPVPAAEAVVLFNMSTGELKLDGVTIATWSGTAWTASGLTHTVTGPVTFDMHSISATITPAPPVGSTVSFALDTGVDQVGVGCPSCHQYGVCPLPGTVVL